MTRGLSKSRISAFEQCPRRLWLQVNRPEEAGVDEQAEMRFTAGRKVDEIARNLVEGGLMIEAEPDLSAALESTRQLLESQPDKPLFQATFERNRVLVRIDVLEPDGDGGWHLAEVKSSTRTKEYHVGDLATQIWAVETSGVKVKSSAIRHIDNEFTLRQEGDYAGLLKDTDISDAIRDVVTSRSILVAEAQAVLEGEEPDHSTGDHCTRPFSCEFFSYCRSREEPGPDWPIAELPQGGKTLAASFAQQGLFDIRDVPDEALTRPIHRRIRDAIITGTPYCDIGAIRSEIDAWEWPRTHLDFETIGPAIPLWIGTRPYQQIPFQFSAHVEEQDGGKNPVHIEFLDLSGEDPRAACAAKLAELPEDGAVIAWNASFERGCLKLLAESAPEHSSKLRSLADRLVDPLPLVRKHYYHPDQRGSWSLKAVLPTLVPDLDYAELDVRDGGMAQLAYAEATAPECSWERREFLDEALRRYCERDTWAMVELIRKLLERE